MKKYGKFTKQQAESKIEDLPLWVQDYIREKTYAIELLQKQLAEFTEEQKPSDISWQYLLNQEHWIPHCSNVKFYFDNEELKSRAYIDVFIRNEGNKRVLEISGSRSFEIKPVSGNSIHIILKSNKEFFKNNE